MSESLQQMLQAMDSLANSIRSISIGNSIQKAQARVDQIRQDQTMDEFQRIEAQQALAKAMGAEVVSKGGNAFMAQQAMASLAPDVPDLQMQRLKATGKGTIADATQALADEQEQKQIASEDRSFARQLKLEELRAARETRLAAMKQQGKELKPIPPAVSNKLSELSDMKSQLIDLKNNFAEKGGQIGPLDQFRPNLLTPAEDVAYASQVKDFFNQYRRVITGAAASIPELKSLLPAVPNEKDLDKDFLAKIDTQIEGVDRALRNRVKLLRAQGRDTSDLEEALGVTADMQQSMPQQQASQQQQQAPAQGSGWGKYIKITPKK